MPPSRARLVSSQSELDTRHTRIMRTAIIFGAINAGFGIIHVIGGNPFELISVFFGLCLIGAGLLTMTRKLWSYVVALATFGLVGLFLLAILALVFLVTVVKKTSQGIGGDVIFLAISMVLYFWYVKVCIDQIRGMNAMNRETSGRTGDDDDEYGDDQANWDRAKR